MMQCCERCGEWYWYLFFVGVVQQDEDGDEGDGYEGDDVEEWFVLVLFVEDVVEKWVDCDVEIECGFVQDDCCVVVIGGCFDDCGECC